MINVCIADNQPVVHFGVVSYFKDHNEIRITHSVTHLNDVLDIFENRKGRCFGYRFGVRRSSEHQCS